MAKQLVYKRSTTEAIAAKGILDEEAKILTYLDDEKMECQIEVQELLNKFASQGVSISIKTQADEELDLEEADEIDVSDLEPSAK